MNEGVLQNDAAHFLNGFKIYFLSFRHNTIKSKMAKTAWHKHVAAFRAAHKGMDNKKVFSEAAKTFNKQSGGDQPIAPPIPVMVKQRGGGQLEYSNFTSSPKLANMVPTDLNVVATNYSGGSKKSKKRGSSKRRGSKRRGTKRRSRH